MAILALTSHGQDARATINAHHYPLRELRQIQRQA